MTTADKLKDAELQISDALNRPENREYWNRRSNALEKAKDLDNLSDRVTSNKQASLSDLKEAAKYAEEAELLRRRANDSSDDLTDFATDPPKQEHSAHANNHKRVIKPDRRGLLWPIIEKAQKFAQNPSDANEVYLILRNWVETNPKETPFYGITPNGLQWINASDKPKELSLKALKGRLNRASKKVR